MQKQYDAYKNERLATCRKSIYDVIPRNNLALFWSKNSIKTTKEKIKVVSLQQERKLYASLYVSCQSIYQYGKLRKGTKADFLACIEGKDNIAEENEVSMSVKIIDGAAMAQMLKPTHAKTFGDYSTEFLKAILRQMSDNLQHVDIVFDRYIQGSLKSETRESRGSGVCILVNEATLEVCKSDLNLIRIRSDSFGFRNKNIDFGSDFDNQIRNKMNKLSMSN